VAVYALSGTPLEAMHGEKYPDFVGPEGSGGGITYDPRDVMALGGGWKF